jgi:hypothetical protein
MPLKLWTLKVQLILQSVNTDFLPFYLAFSTFGPFHEVVKWLYSLLTLMSYIVFIWVVMLGGLVGNQHFGVT